MSRLTRISQLTATDGGSSANPVSFNLTIPAECTYLALLAVNQMDGTPNTFISGITVGGDAMAPIISHPATGSAQAHVEVWDIEAPSVGSQAFQVTYVGPTTNRAFIALFFKDQNASEPVVSTVVVNTGQSATPNVGPLTADAHSTVYTAIAWNTDVNSIDGTPIAQTHTFTTDSNSKEIAVYEDAVTGDVSRSQVLTQSRKWVAVQFALRGVVPVQSTLSSEFIGTFPDASERLFVRASAIEVDDSNDIIPTAGWTATTRAESRTDPDAVVVRGEYLIAAAQSATSEPSAAFGDTASLMFALAEASFLGTLSSPTVDNITDVSARPVVTITY